MDKILGGGRRGDGRTGAFPAGVHSADDVVIRLPRDYIPVQVALHVPLKTSDNKRIYAISFPHPVADADIAEATKSAQDGVGAGQLAVVAVERSAESREDDIGGGDV